MTGQKIEDAPDRRRNPRLLARLVSGHGQASAGKFFKFSSATAGKDG
jgi:hypothetical protein